MSLPEPHSGRKSTSCSLQTDRTSSTGSVGWSRRPDRLLEPVEQLPPRPRRGEVDGPAADGEGQPAGGRPGGLHDQPLGQVHPVGDVAEGPVGLEGGELRAVPGVDALVAEVAGDLEDPLVAPHHQALEVELGGDAQAEVDVEGVGVGHERPGQGAAGLGLEDRGVHLDEVLGHQLPRRAAMVLNRMSNTRRLSGLASRSTSRWR